jgi:hypothetical protein
MKGLLEARELELQYRLKQGAESADVAALMMTKQDDMVLWGWVEEKDFRHLNKCHLMSAELVIGDLLRELKAHGHR